MRRATRRLLILVDFRDKKLSANARSNWAQTHANVLLQVSRETYTLLNRHGDGTVNATVLVEVVEPQSCMGDFLARNAFHNSHCDELYQGDFGDNGAGECFKSTVACVAQNSQLHGRLCVPIRSWALLWLTDCCK